MKIKLLICIIIIFSIEGCYSWRTIAEPNHNAVVANGETTVHTYLWGILKNPSKPVIPENCRNNPLAEVNVYMPWYYTLVSVVTLGIYVPIEVQWGCAQCE